MQLSPIIRVQIELPVAAVNKVNSFIHAILNKEARDVSYIPPSEWRLPLLTIRNFPEEAIWAIRDYARKACANRHPIGLSLTRVAIDRGGNVMLPLVGAVSEIENCVNSLEDVFKTKTTYNISANTNPAIVVGHLAGQEEERSVDFRHPVSWNANSICLTQPGPRGIEHRLFVIFFEEANNVTVHG